MGRESEMTWTRGRILSNIFKFKIVLSNKNIINKENLVKKEIYLKFLCFNFV